MTAEAGEPIALLHIHAQYDNHDEAFIRGNRLALTRLHGVIGEAIRNGAGSVAEFFTADGEGYAGMVVMDDSDWQTGEWANSLLPYHRMAESNGDEVHDGAPWELPQSRPLYRQVGGSRGHINPDGQVVG